jgi:hypothetical protein
VTLSPDKVEQVLRRTATDTPCPAQEPFGYPSNPGVFDATRVGTPAFNGFYGDGIVNALAASKSGGGGRWRRAVGARTASTAVDWPRKPSVISGSSSGRAPNPLAARRGQGTLAA